MTYENIKKKYRIIRGRLENSDGIKEFLSRNPKFTSAEINMALSIMSQACVQLFDTNATMRYTWQINLRHSLDSYQTGQLDDVRIQFLVCRQWDYLDRNKYCLNPYQKNKKRMVATGNRQSNATLKKFLIGVGMMEE